MDETHPECDARRSTMSRSGPRSSCAIKGKKTVDEFHRELGKVVWDECGMGRNARGLDEALTRIPEIREEFWRNVRVPGSGNDLNQELEKAGRVADFLELGELLARDARVREESAGRTSARNTRRRRARRCATTQNFCHVAVWEYAGENSAPALQQRAADVRERAPAATELQVERHRMKITLHIWRQKDAKQRGQDGALRRRRTSTSTCRFWKCWTC